MLIEAVRRSADLRLAGALDLAGSPALGRTPPPSSAGSGVTIDRESSRARSAEVLIDFTRPDGTLAHVAACRDSASRR